MHIYLDEELIFCHTVLQIHVQLGLWQPAWHIDNGDIAATGIDKGHEDLASPFCTGKGWNI